MNRRALFLAGALALVPAAAAANEDVSKPQTRLTTAASYVPLPAIVAATPVGRSIGGQLTVDLGLDVPDEKQRKRAIAMRPRLQDALRAAVSDYAAVRMRPRSPPDPVQISAMAQRAVDGVLGPNVAKVVLSNVMSMQR